MKITLERQESQLTCTPGSLFIDGEFECFTLEDVVREVPGTSVADWKIKGETAIPAGTYVVRLTFSNRFQKVLPLLVDVPGFEGVRIHSGNTDADTEGCILVGQEQNNESILKSRLALQNLMDKLTEATGRGEPIEIEITNP